MSGKVAIVAHFDPAGRIAPSVIDMLDCLEAVFDRVVFVSTSSVYPEELKRFGKVDLIVRPNIGYDFYSYRVGLHRAGADADKVLLINTSMIILDPALFASALRTMLAAPDSAVGLALSRQFENHLQSFMLLLGREVFAASWFRAFIDDIEPLGDKMEIVQRYEIGLSRALKAHGVPLTALYTPTEQESRAADARWQSWLESNHRSPAAAPANQYNPMQFHAEAIARRFGIIKSEVLRDNPHGVDLSFLPEIAPPECLATIERMMEQDRQSYAPAKPGSLSSTAANTSPVPTAKIATWGTPHANGIRIAAVAHIYFPDLLDDIFSQLENIIEPFDLYLTTPHEDLVAPLLRRGAKLARSVTVALTENRGRDLGPFLRLYRDGWLDGYLAALKLHTKKSRYSDKGDIWRDALLDDLVGDSLKVRRTIALFEKEAIGIIGPKSDYLSNPSFWGSNRARVEALLSAIGASGDGQPALGFFAGSMFWFAPAAFAPLKTIPDAQLVFEPETGQQDGTLAHALERLLAPLARSHGFVTTSLPLRGAEIATTDTSQNRVPVL